MLKTSFRTVWGAALGVVGYGIRLIGGTNLITLVFGSTLGTIGILPISMMISIYLIDVMQTGEMDYFEIEQFKYLL